MMGSIAKTQTALIGDVTPDIILVHDAPIPKLEHDRVFVEVKAVALNPVDTKMTGPYHTPGAISGCDYAGIVLEVGSTVAAEGRIKVGDRISVAVSGLNPNRPDVGAFAKFSTAPAWACLKLPPSWTFGEGASLGISWTTVWNGLFFNLGLFFPVPGQDVLDPDRKIIPVLVYGGSSAAGTCALQTLRLAGYQTIATCSPRNFDMVRSFGADHVFDYKSPTCADEIRALTRNNLHHVLDCIGDTDSIRLCLAALGRTGGHYTSLNPPNPTVAATRKKVKCDWVMGPEMLGEEVRWPEPHYRSPNAELQAAAAGWIRSLQILLDRDLLKLHPLLVQDTGLKGVLEGFHDIRAGKVAGKKLIYNME